MRFVISLFLLAAVIQGCVNSSSESSEKASAPTFRFGDKVYIADGFYHGTKGRILFTRMWGSDWVCKIAATFVSTDGKFTRNEDAEFPCKDLIVDASD